jgi:hypothetical protein
MRNDRTTEVGRADAPLSQSRWKLEPEADSLKSTRKCVLHFAVQDVVRQAVLDSDGSLITCSVRVNPDIGCVNSGIVWDYCLSLRTVFDVIFDDS